MTHEEIIKELLKLYNDPKKNKYDDFQDKLLEHKDNKELIRQLLLEHLPSKPDIFVFFPYQLAEDYDLALIAIKQDGLNLKYASYEMHDNEEIVLMASDKINYAFDFATDRLKNNKEFIKKILVKNGRALQYLSAKYQDDKELVLLAIQDNDSLQYVSKRLKNDQEVIKACFNVHNNHSVLRDIGVHLKADIDFMLPFLKIEPKSFIYCSEEIRKNREIVEMVLAKNGEVYSAIGRDLKNDKKLLLLALQTYPSISKMIIGEQLKEEVGDNDLKKYLEADFLNEKLQETIPEKEETQKVKIKI